MAADAGTQDRRAALVTGAMGGLGTELCRRLHAEGFLVAATHSPQNARREAWLARQQAEGIDVRAYELDVSNGNACDNVVRRVLGDLGRIDVLVNNAGVTRDRSMRKMRQEDWHTVMGINLDSVFNMTRPVLETMIARRWGRTVNISSVNGQQGAFGQANYAAAKAGMHGFTKSLALEVARHGITVNTVSPGYLDTAMVSQVPPEMLRDRILPQIPVGHWASR